MLLWFSRVLDVNKWHPFEFSAAGNAFCRAASVQTNIDSRHEAASNYVEAGNCFKKADAAGICIFLIFLLLILTKI